jgi:hypothetical protein
MKNDTLSTDERSLDYVWTLESRYSLILDFGCTVHELLHDKPVGQLEDPFSPTQSIIEERCHMKAMQGKDKLFLVLAFLMAVLLLAACGTTPATTTPEPTDEPVVELRMSQ